VKVLVDGEEFYQIPDEKLLYGDIEGNGKIRIEIMNQYGNGTYDPTSEFYVEEFFNKAAELEGSEVAVTFDITGIPEEAPTPVDPTPVDPTEHKYALETEDGETEAEVSLKVGDSYDFSVILTDDGEPVEGEDIIWAEVDDTSATAVTSVGDVEPTAVKTDEDGVSTITLYAQKVGSGTITATYTDEDGEEYVVTFKATITAADESSSSSSSQGNNSGNGGSSSGAAAEDSNPATGAAALGTVGILLAGAAMAVSKKKQ
ncbi:MAG: Ig-like domain-containing protein, partial [Ruminococcus sp.]|nr:Ig-like domain-containing protein [Ruminococcus sp.]